MSSNKSAKNKLIELYGEECFIDKLHLRPGGYKEKYTSKAQRKRTKQLTYHHILEKRNRWTSNNRKWCSAFGRKSCMVSQTK